MAVRPTKRRRHLLAGAAWIALACLSPLVLAGEFSDQLADCLRSSLTEEDGDRLVRWMFASIALHPALSEVSALSLSHREQANREMAESLIDLLSVRCYSETQLALRNEGVVALQTGLGTLGSIAATELFADSQVTAALSSLETYISAEDLERRLEIGQ